MAPSRRRPERPVSFASIAGGEPAACAVLAQLSLANGSSCAEAAQARVSMLVGIRIGRARLSPFRKGWRRPARYPKGGDAACATFRRQLAGVTGADLVSAPGTSGGVGDGASSAEWAGARRSGGNERGGIAAGPPVAGTPLQDQPAEQTAASPAVNQDRGDNPGAIGELLFFPNRLRVLPDLDGGQARALPTAASICSDADGKRAPDRGDRPSGTRHRTRCRTRGGAATAARAVVQDLRENVQHIAAVVALAGEQSVGDQPQGVPVGRRGDATLRRGLLGGHVPRCSQDLSGAGPSGALLGHLDDAEIENLDNRGARLGPGQEQILRV